MVWRTLRPVCDDLLPLVHINGIMDKNAYKRILEDHKLPYAGKKMFCECVFQQYYDPKHISKMLTNWFIAERREDLDCPSRSPDLNPIKYHWEYFGRTVRIQKHFLKSELLQDHHSAQKHDLLFP
ncbi:paired box protein and transposase domain containing protein [Trichonephila clavata]|uniref:Paired box protein and transposase domain containing protein n=1 Tax=Trichonephila clavata TaxID=2740835 RepID=A0A8X6KVZ3_TRICU|nr:paired box protein and transposase domain containing protein [Trichonephila clavata]